MMSSTLRNLLVSVVIFLLVVGTVVFSLISTLNKSQVLEEQIIALAATNQQEEALLRLERVAQASEAERAELASYFLLRESDSISFLSEIESIAPNLGVGLETTSLRQTSADGKEWIEAALTVSGSRTAVERFIETLEVIPFVSRIASITMQGNTPANWQADITVQLQLLNYVQ
jgi:hypothetical protein